MSGEVVCSFDVFDTLLTRSLGDGPSTILAVGHQVHTQLLASCEPAAYAAVRLAAERALFDTLKAQPRLADICDEVARRLGTPGMAPAFVAAELDCERKASRALPAAADLIQSARDRTGTAVIFLSDTPLPASFITDLLQQAGLFRPGDQVFSSADCGATKAAGGLFHAAREALQTDAVIEHVGDNLESDVINARRSGWKATLAPAGAFNRYESRLAAATALTNGAGGAWAGASRIARLAAVQRGAAEPLAAVAAGVTAPLLGNYVTWVLRCAKEQGLKQLYFISRDGEILLRVAHALAPRIAPDVECRYLHGSRQAWRTASIVSVGPPPHWLARSAESAIPQQLFDEVGLSAAQVFELTGAAVASPERATHPVSAEELGDLEALMSDPRLQDAILDYSRRQREAALRYFVERGFGSTDYAIVDTGWVGRSAKHLCGFVAGSACEPPRRFFYVGLNSGADNAAGPVRSLQQAWLFDEDRGLGKLPNYSGFSTMLETFCAGTEGRTVRYREDSVAGPVLDPPRNEAMLRWGLRELQDTVVAAVENFVESGVDPATSYDLTDVLRDVVSDFWLRPTRAEAELWGRAPFEDEQLGLFDAPLAPPVDGSFVRAQARAGRISLRPHYTWAAGTAQRSSAPWRQVLLTRQEAAKLITARNRVRGAFTRRWRRLRAR